jgi:hypothetical protein
MLVSLFILLFSLAALVYWLRDTIVTILDSQSATAEAVRLAEANRLEFPLVRQALEAAAELGQYGRLAESLRHDFLALTYLLRFAATVNVGRYSREEQLLVVDFHLMRVLYTIGSTFSPRLARFALVEMTSVLEHFAGVMSRRMNSFSLDAMGA